MTRPPGDPGMDPIDETREALAELDPLVDGRLLEGLQDRAAQVRQVVPECVGLSLTFLDQDLAFTLVATGADVAALDAVQYLDGGPCVELAPRAEHGGYTWDEFVEERWQLFAHATAAAGVASTLTLPVLESDGRVVGSVNLYGSTPTCFEGHHDELASVLDAWASGAVTNADLSFRTRHEAQRAPDKLRARARIDTAVGVIAAHDSISVEEATRALHEAAGRAGVDVVALAEAVLASRRPRER